MRKTHLLTSALCGAAMALCFVTPGNAQDDQDGGRGAAAPVPQMPFHLVEDFFHYPAHSVIGRVSGIAVGPNGNIVALNRGYHPVLEFKPDGTFYRSWGEGSTMFVGAHRCASIRRAISGMWMPPMTLFTASIPKAAPWARSEQMPEPWTWLTHVIERAAPGKAVLLSGDRYRLEQGWQHVRLRRIRQFARRQVR